MLGNLREVVRPASVEEAVQRMVAAGGALRPIAGGTATSAFRSREVEGVLDLWSLPLRFVRRDGVGLHLGATATFGDLVRSDVVRGFAGGALAEAAGRAASTTLRNLITVGGNLAGLYPWSDLPPVLLVLGARAEIAGPAGPGLAVEELVEHHPSKRLGHHSLLTGVVVPEPPATSAAAFLKQGESAFDYGLVDVAAWVDLDGRVCRGCRLAVGAVEPRCRRLPEVERLLAGQTLDGERAAAAGRLAAESVRPSADARASEGYRRHLVSVLVARALLEAGRRACGGAA